MLITILTVTSSPLTSAIDIEIDAPKEVETGEAFWAEVEADTEETHDVKIFVHNSEENTIPRDSYVSEIYDKEEGDWEDPWYYLSEAYPDQREYEIIVGDETGEMEICVRMRKSSNPEDGFEQTCSEIDVLEKESDDEEEKEEEKEEEEENNGENEDEEKNYRTSTQNTKDRKVPEVKKIQLSQQQEKIVLNSEKPATQGKTKITTPEGNKRMVVISSFTGFCILVIVLLSLKKL